MRVRAWARSMWRKERLNPRTPVRAPTPTATATMTKRKRVRAARISRQAMRMAVVQGSFGMGLDFGRRDAETPSLCLCNVWVARVERREVFGNGIRFVLWGASARGVFLGWRLGERGEG